MSRAAAARAEGWPGRGLAREGEGRAQDDVVLGVFVRDDAAGGSLGNDGVRLFGCCLGGALVLLLPLSAAAVAVAVAAAALLLSLLLRSSARGALSLRLALAVGIQMVDCCMVCVSVWVCLAAVGVLFIGPFWCRHPTAVQ